MFSIVRLLTIGALWMVVTSAARAQTAPPTHPIRSLSPADTSFADLEFLVREIGGARVVLLGEPTHGEGNVTEAKIRLLRFLRQRLGFTTVAFESGFYELDKAQRMMQTGTPAGPALASSVFPVWTRTREFQAILPLLGPNRLRVAGFDPQLSGEYQDEMVDELQALLKPEKGAETIHYDYLDEVFSAMGTDFTFPPTHQLPLFEQQCAKAGKLLQQVARTATAERRARATFWLQNLRSLQSLARDYVHHDPTAKGPEEFRASDSNGRDAQMADNLLWYLRQHPGEKVACWGALPHFANKVAVLGAPELQTYRPMGQSLKAALGPDAVYILGTLSAGGVYHSPASVQPQAVPAPAPASLEAELAAQAANFSFVSLKHDAPGRVLTTSALEYQPLRGAWSEVIDGFLFIRAVNPPHVATGEPAPPDVLVAALAASEPVARLGRINPATRPRSSVGAGGAAITVRGVVLDHKTGAPVAFASVAVPGRGRGAVADAEGRFSVSASPQELLQISSVGYQEVTATASGRGSMTVRLAPATYALGDVRVSAASQNPQTILQKVIQAIPQNYDLGDNTTELYVHRQISNFDTVQYEVEYLADAFVPTGYRKYNSFSGPKPQLRVHNAHVVKGSTRELTRDALFGGMGGMIYSADPIRIAPLFEKRNRSKYVVQLDTVLQQGSATTYVLRFAAKQATKRTTGTSLTAGLRGRLYIEATSYAVTRYEALWQEDTVHVNAVAHKYYGQGSGRGGSIAHLYNSVYSDWRSSHVVSYARGADGRYRVGTSQMQAVLVGRWLGKAAFHYQVATDLHFGPARPGPAAELSGPNAVYTWEVSQIKAAPYDAELWQRYQRPSPARREAVLLKP